MSLLETFQMAIKNILSSKMRTFLTMLGIIIGVCAVIVIVGLGNGMQGYIEDSFADMGTDSLTVQILGLGSSRSVSEEQMYALVEDNPDLFKEISPTVTMLGALKIGSDTISTSSITGVSEDYFDMKGYEVAQGRGLDYVDMNARKKVCIVGQYLNMAYFGGNAVGQTIKIGSTRYTIVSVLEAKVTDLENQEGSNDDMIFVPYTTALRVAKSSTVSSYSVTIADESKLSEGKTIFEDALKSLLHSDSGYMVTSLSEMLDTMTSMVNMVVTILTAIAAISLLVGGIGIMNIMMVSVTERTREIGIRKALGAQESTILGLFVTEAAATSALGGVLGIGLGYLLSAVANHILPMVLTDMTLTVSPSIGSVAVAFSISVGIGVLFGFLPARRAARLNPIEALRYD